MSENHFNCILPLMHAKGVSLSPREFHHMVNVTFHRFESAHYDQLHQEMWNDLPAQFELLCQDLIQKGEDLPEKLRVLDVGCGTGLSSQLLLGTCLGKRIHQIDLLDTSSEMLAKCAERAARWGVTNRQIHGTVETINDASYDLVLTCSVLHHIPDLQTFLRQIRKIQSPRGIFIHFQDPNGDYLADPDLLRRSRALELATKKSKGWRAKVNLPLRLLRRLLRLASPQQSSPRKNYIDQINEALLSSNTIKTPLTDAELWSVTDIHENNLPFSTGKGISIPALKGFLPDYALVSARSYSFFGKMGSTLPPAMKAEELKLIRQRAMTGKHISAVWRLRL